MSLLGGKRILLVEHQPLVAADIEDCLLEAGVAEVSVISKPAQILDLQGFDAMIINATEHRELARDAIKKTSGAEIPLVVLHDEIVRAREVFPTATVVEIPFDAEAVRAALVQALKQRASISG